MALGTGGISAGGISSTGSDDALVVSAASGTVWAGTLVGGRLVANSASDFWVLSDASPFFSQADSGEFWHDAYYAMTYRTPEFTPTKGEIGSQMTLDVEITGQPVRIEYRSAPQLPMFPRPDVEPFWSEDGAVFYPDPFFGDIPFITWPGVLTAINEQYQFQFFTGGGPVQGVIGACKVVIDVPDLVEYFNDFVVGAGGVRLPITKTYNVIKNVQITVQADGGTAVTAEIVDKNVTLGPLIRCRDASGASVSGTVDVVLQAY